MILTTSVGTVIPTNYTCFRDIFTFSENVAMPLKSHILSSGIGTNSRIFHKIVPEVSHHITHPKKPQNHPKNSQKKEKKKTQENHHLTLPPAPRPYHPALLQWLNKDDPRRHHNWLPHRNKRLEPPSERASVRYEEAPKAKPQGRGTAPLSQWMGYIICRYYQFQWW